jgi:hypothetical protein
LIKLDQTWSNWIPHQSKNVTIILIFWIRSVKRFGQKELFGSNGFSSKNTFVKFEVAFWPEMAFFK